MRKILLFILLSFIALPGYSQRTKSRGGNNFQAQLSLALKQAQSGNYMTAANNLFSLSRRAEMKAERPQIKYILGTMLMELKLNQIAAFQFVDVIRTNDPKYSRMAIEKLSIVADALGDDTILNYAISKVNVSEFPAQQRDLINYRLGEIKLRARDYVGAVGLFSKVPPQSTYYFQALYNKGLAELEGNSPQRAIATFNRMLDERRRAPVTDVNKVSAQMGLARALYQKQDWDAAIEAYAQVPRDTVQWHDSVFEQSWAMLRSARFRSALSNFQTLHSIYYEDFYMPESLLLRAIVYLYICKYDEMEKVLNLFERTYGPVRRQIGDFLKYTNNANDFFSEIEKARMVKAHARSENLRLPYIVSRSLLDQGDVKRSLNYLDKVNAERVRIEKLDNFRTTSLGKYSLKILNNRMKNTRFAIGDMAKAHLLNMRVELKDLYEQAGFIRYEMLTGKKDSIKKRITGKALDEDTIDEKINRNFYIENGYEYYPFRGEYWLDEIGNYHYLGKQSCE